MSDTEFPRLRLSRLAAWLGGNVAFASSARTARLLGGFARTEAQSSLELRRAAQVCEDIQRRALYLRHALDEARHAQAFAEQASIVARTAGLQTIQGPAAGSEDLFERHGEARFLAFVHHGERRGRLQFEVYARLLRRKGQHSLAELFELLVADELQHEAYAARVLLELAGPRAAQRARRWAARSETWRGFRRSGRRMAGAVYSACMLLVYLALAPYALAFKALSKPPRGLSFKA